MVSARGTKRTRSASVDSESVAEKAVLSVATVDTAPPQSKRAAISPNAETLADLGNSDDEVGSVAGSDLEEDNEELSPEAAQAAILAGELVEDEEDDGDDEWEDDPSDELDNEQDESSAKQLQVEIDGIVIDPDNIERFWARIRLILMTLLGLVKSLSGSSMFAPATGRNLPVLRKWYSFLSKVDIEYLLQIYFEAVPLQVQTVLGQKTFGVADLLRLVGDWKDPSWGVYLEILTKATRPITEWFRLYVGSATRKDLDGLASGRGFWARICTYFGWIKKEARKRLMRKLESEGELTAKPS